MLDILFLLVWFFFLLMVIFSLRLVVGDKFLSSAIGVTILFVLIYNYLGLPLLYYRLIDYRVETGITDKYIVLKVFFLTLICLSSILLGGVCSKVFLLKAKGLPRVTLSPSVEEGSAGIWILGILCIWVLAQYVSVIGVYNLALSSALGFSDSGYSIELRSAMGNGFEGNYNWYALFMRDGLTLVFMYFYSQSHLRKDSWVDVIPVFLFAPILLFSVLMATEKMPVIELFFALFILRSLLEGREGVEILPMLKFAIASLSVLSIAYVFFMGADNVAAGLTQALSRALTGQIQPAYHYLELFPKEWGYLYGASFPNPGGLLPYEPFPLTLKVAEWKNAQLGNFSLVGSAPTIFWGELYANFGYFLVAPISFLIGFFLYTLDFWMRKKVHAVFGLVFYVWLIVHYKDLALTNFSSFLIDIKALSLFFVYFAFYKIFRKFGRLRFSRFA